jgi:prepilin-type N-terminal cleavage/methylation domain-containing protein
MTMHQANQQQKGFSLVELMIVVAIIGVLAGLAVPKFSQFQQKAKQAEAKTNLAALQVAQEAHSAERELGFYDGTLTLNDFSTATSCNGANALGFAISNCIKARYWYASVVAVAGTFDGYATEVTVGGARRVFPGCAGTLPTPPSSASATGTTVPTQGNADQWKITQNKVITQLGTPGC